MNRSFSLALALVVVAALAGCGSSGKGKSSSSTATAAAAASAASAAATTSTTTTAGAATAAGGETISTKPSKLGTIIAGGPKHLTVYLFEGDKGGRSACSGACATYWPPVTTSGQPQAAAGAIAADLGTITRADGAQQVTYRGHPLYYFAQDKDSGDAYGEGSKAFGASWYVLRPNGTKIDKS